MNNGSRAAPFRDFDDTSALDVPRVPKGSADRDSWREHLIYKAIPVAVMNGSTFKAMKPGEALADTCPIDYDPLFAATMEARLGGLLSQLMTRGVEPPTKTRGAEGVEAQRLLNRQFYEDFKTEIDKRYHGRVVVIANGAIAAVADSFEAVKEIAGDANHRLVFRAGEPEWRTRRLRLPISRK